MATPAPLSIQFRKAARRDVPRLVELYMDCFSKWSKAEEIPDYIETMATNRNWQLIVAEDTPGHIAGFVLVNCNYADGSAGSFVNVDVLAVDKDSRRLGLGKSLMGMSEMVARNENAAFVSLQVHEDNDGGLKLYHALKFNEVSRREGYYSDGRAAIDMIKVLGPAAANDVEPHPATVRDKKTFFGKLFGT